MRYWTLCATLLSTFFLASLCTSASAEEKMIWKGDANLQKGMLRGKVTVLTCYSIADNETSLQGFSNCSGRAEEHAAEVEDLNTASKLSGNALKTYQDGFRLGVSYYAWSALTTLTDDAKKRGSAIAGQIESDMQSFYSKFRSLQLKYSMPDSSLLDIMVSDEDRPSAVQELEHATRKKAKNN